MLTAMWPGTALHAASAVLVLAQLALFHEEDMEPVTAAADLPDRIISYLNAEQKCGFSIVTAEEGLQMDFSVNPKPEGMKFALVTEFHLGDLVNYAPTRLAAARLAIEATRRDLRFVLEYKGSGSWISDLLFGTRPFSREKKDVARRKLAGIDAWVAQNVPPENP